MRFIASTGFSAKEPWDPPQSIFHIILTPTHYIHHYYEHVKGFKIRKLSNYVGLEAGEEREGNEEIKMQKWQK